MTPFSIYQAALALALACCAFACFEVPPLPDSVLECSGIDDCGDDQTCIDGACASAELVTLYMSCKGLPETFLAVACDGRVTLLPCTDSGAESLIECPTSTRVQVCCGTERGCEGMIPLTPFAPVITLDITPESEWICPQIRENVNARACVHPGFAPSLDDVADIECDSAPGLLGMGN